MSRFREEYYEKWAKAAKRHKNPAPAREAISSEKARSESVRRQYFRGTPERRHAILQAQKAQRRLM